MSPAARIRPLAAAGNSIIEVVIASSLVVTLLLAVLPSLLLGSRSVERVSSRAQTLDQARDALARMSREIRSAAAVTAASTQIVDLSAWSDGSLVAVRIDCSQPGPSTGTFSCVRTRHGASDVLLAEIHNASPFRISADGRYLEIEVEQMPRDGARTMILRVGVGLRGCAPHDGILGTCQGAVL